MSQQTMCDGCGKRLEWKDGLGRERVVIAGERVNELCGGGLPDGRFDWCRTCAGFAFDAVRQQQHTVPLAVLKDK